MSPPVVVLLTHGNEELSHAAWTESHEGPADKQNLATGFRESYKGSEPEGF